MRVYLRVWLVEDDVSRVYVCVDVAGGTVHAGPPEHLFEDAGVLVWGRHVEGGVVPSVSRELFESSCGVLVNGLLERL